MTEDQNDRPNAEGPSPGHWQVLRDALVFQFKLVLDGLRDVLLSPISVGAAIFGLIFSPDNPGLYFNKLLKFGRKTDVWINLFGASSHYVEGERDGDSESKKEQHQSSDAYVKKLEDLLLTEYKKGGFVKNLKEGTDTLLDKLHKKDQ